MPLSCVGFGAITTFIVLLFVQRGWAQAWLASTAVSIAFAFGRIAFGHLLERIEDANENNWMVDLLVAGTVFRTC
jgi:hypothetical protein